MTLENGADLVEYVVNMMSLPIQSRVPLGVFSCILGCLDSFSLGAMLDERRVLVKSGVKVGVTVEGGIETRTLGSRRCRRR
jgi:hypothetical protein